MPYVKRHKRLKLDKLVDAMAEAGIKADGDLNYVLYAFCKRHIEPSYGNYKNYRGELKECHDEIGRRMLAPYEDEKKRTNGDIYKSK